MQAQQENIRDGNFYFPRLESNVKRFLSDPVNPLFFSKKSVQLNFIATVWPHRGLRSLTLSLKSRNLFFLYQNTHNTGNLRKLNVAAHFCK